MKFDIFCEIQKAFPWKGGDEASLFAEIVAQARAADEAGFDTWWQVEHLACSPKKTASPFARSPPVSIPAGTSDAAAGVGAGGAQGRTNADRGNGSAPIVARMRGAPSLTPGIAIEK